ncbi:hypothetical protein COB52_05370 [Candidatus Kaiserbacteria bacterium]|nr:MAG: hypothetical protein COB52_05370 [Candidatus Kaiserbacteria bacterium]
MSKPSKGKGRKGAKEKDSPDKKDETEKIDFRPTIDECCKFFKNAFNEMIDSTNLVSVLEHDLMPFLDTNEYPNFKLDLNFPWFQDALDKVSNMLEENIIAPLALLDTYKEFEFVAKTSKTKLVKDLFGGEEQATIEELRAKLAEYDEAHDKIMNLSNGIVEFPIFRVMAGKMKKELGDKVNKLKEEILKAIAKYCINSVERIDETYT